MNGRPTVLGEGRQYAATRALFEREQVCVGTFAKALITPVSDDRFWRIALKKSFSGGRTKNLRTADAVRARRRKTTSFHTKTITGLRISARTLRTQRCLTIDFREIFRDVRFSTFATVLARSGHAAAFF